MRKKVAVYLDTLITFLLLAVAGLTPLLFLNQTSEFYEMPKLILLVVTTLLILGLWIFSWIVKGKVVITRTPLDIPLLILLGAVILSAYFSTTKNIAIYGNFPRVHGSAVAWTTYILLYFVAVSYLRSVSWVKGMLYVFYGSGILVTIASLLSFFNIFLPFDFVKSVNFTPTGSTFSTVALLLLLLPFPLVSIIKRNKFMPLIAAVILSTLFSITIALIGSVSSHVVLILTIILCLFVSKPQKNRKSLAMFAIPVVLTVLIFVMAYMPFPGNLGKLHQLESSFPKEIQLPFGISWKVSVSAFRDAPFIGTGPSTYLYNFTTYKPAEYNTLSYWNVGFDTAYNEFLQVLATTGGVGIWALVTLCLVVLNLCRKSLTFKNPAVSNSNEASQIREDSMQVLLSGFTISALLAVILMAIHATTLVSAVGTLMVFAIFMASQKSIREHIMELSLGLRASTSNNRHFDLLPVIIFILFLVGAVPALINTYKVVLADYYHRLALSQANKNGTLTYQYLQKAEVLNPYVDLYRVDLAQTNFALANALVAQKGPSKDNPKGSLTDNDKKTIQTLLSQSINEGRASTALSPRSARNWEVLASIYRNISGVAKNALNFSLEAYGRAIQRDPLNPALRVSVGGIYYSVKNYDTAIRYFSDAINLKPDYSNAYFNLSIAYREKGDVASARVVAERTVSLLSKNKNSNDYKIATKLLDNLKSKEASIKESAPAAATSSALQNPQISGVNVSNLNNPPQVTPVPSIRPNPAANIPQVKPATNRTTPTGAVAPTTAVNP